MSENYKFHQHKACEFFPCHKGLSEESFNCLFCYCPLYLLREDCGGNFSYMENGIKNCTDCTVPHCGTKGYDHVMSKMNLLMDGARRK